MAALSPTLRDDVEALPFETSDSCSMACTTVSLWLWLEALPFETRTQSRRPFVTMTAAQSPILLDQRLRQGGEQIRHVAMTARSPILRYMARCRTGDTY